MMRSQVEAAGSERRRAARALRQWPVEIRNGSGRMWQGTSVDISTTGMRVRINRPLEVRWFMLITFYSFDPGGSVGPFWTRFSLVREIVASREYGIQFLDLPRRDIDRLQTLLAL